MWRSPGALRTMLSECAQNSCKVCLDAVKTDSFEVHMSDVRFLRSENNSWLEDELAKASTSLLVQQQRLVEERGDRVMADLVQQLQHQVDVLRTENLEARLEILACCAIGL